MPGHRRLATTRTQQSRQLGLGGQPLLEWYPQLVAALRAQLGDAYVSLLAEPVVSEDGTVDWFVDLDGEALELAETDQAQLDQTLGEIRAASARLAEGAPEDQSHAELLRLLAESPGEAQRVGDQLVLVGWGTQGDALAAPPGQLMRPGAGLASGRTPFAFGLPLALLLLWALLGLCTLGDACGCVPLPRLPDDTVRLAALDEAQRDHAALLEKRDDLRDELGVAKAECERQRLLAEERERRLEEERLRAEADDREREREAQEEEGRRRREEFARLQQAEDEQDRLARERRELIRVCEQVVPPGAKPKVVVALDASESMGEPVRPFSLETRMQRAHRSIERLVPSLPPSVDIGLLEFGWDRCRVRDHGFFSNARRGQMLSRLGRIRPRGKTPIAEAMERGGQLLLGSDPDQPALLVLVTDGRESCRGDPCGTAARLKNRMPNLKIVVIDLQENRALSCITRLADGQVIRPDRSANLGEVLREATIEALRDPRCRTLGSR